MAKLPLADVDDRWHRFVKDRDGEPVKIRTARYGQGKRWLARWRDERGHQRKKSFERKIDAEQYVAKVTTDLARGDYIDPRAGRVRVADYARQWLAAQTFDATTREAVDSRLRVHVFPVLGAYELRALRPSVIQAWLGRLDQDLARTYTRVIFANVSTLLQAAVDDGLIAKNPCRAGSVRPPRRDPRQVEPWPQAWVLGMAEALPDRYARTVILAAGCGLRQGEVFGLAVEDVDFLRGVVHVRRQVRSVAGRPVFASPKGRKTRDVPLPQSVALALSAHLSRYPACAVSLPWEKHEGKTATAQLIFSTSRMRAINRSHFDRHLWKRARKVVGIEQSGDNGMHALRHYFASAALDGGASIKELAEWLGHSDPGFTLRVYCHLMPHGGDRMRHAIDRALDPNTVTDATAGGM